jgi:dienelactone hydrolase
MVVWGGLRPILGQVFVDVLALVGCSYSAATPPTKQNGATLLATGLLMVILSGNLSNRWTIVFPMVPLFLLQGLRRLFSNKYIGGILCVLSFFFIILAGLLSVLFPAVELPPVLDAPYNVGVIDLFLPVAFAHSTTIPGAQDDDVCPPFQDHVSVRILYPTLDKPDWVPYLRPTLSEIFCEETMLAGAPPPLKPFGWILHTWRLTQMKATRNAQPLDLNEDGGLPIIAYSHGLGGNADLYSYQTSALAAHGYVVVVVDHTDGSAPVVPLKDGLPLRRNDSHVVLHDTEGRYELHKQGRRAMTEYRAEELVAAVEGILRLDEETIPELALHNVSFVGKLNVDELHYMGHSFGGATSLHAARKGRPPTSIIAHEPASDWIPDATRASLFDLQRLEGSRVNSTRWQVHNVTDDNLAVSVHDHEMLILFSHEWETKKWGGVDVLLDMHERGRFGPAGSGASQVAVIAGAHHSEFSDTCMLTPTWLARATGITGERNPLETALEIHQHTLSFLKALRKNKLS